MKDIENSDRNYEIFQHDPALLNVVSLSKGSVEILQTRNGMKTARINGSLLHSMINPEREAERFAEGCSVQAGQRIILYGLGLGHHVASLARRLGRSGVLVVIELNPDLLDAALRTIDIRGFEQHCSFELVSGVSEQDISLKISELSSRYGNGNWTYLVHPASYKCIPEKFSRISDLFATTLMDKRTSSVFRNQFIDNFEKNLDVVLRSPGIAHYRNNYTGKPVVIVGAGPSLDGQLRVLQRGQEYVHICAVDTAFPILIQHGIRPDCVVTVDPQSKTAHHFSEVSTESIPLIISPVSCAQTVACYGGPYIVFLQKDHSVTGAYENVLGDKGFTEAGGSVSCIAIDIMAQFGFNSIILAGMDYSFPNMQAYSAYAHESKQLMPYSHRFRPIANFHYERIYSDRTVTVRSVEGARVLSHLVLDGYRKNIEKLVEKYRPKVTFYSMSDCGARISGVEAMCSNKLLRYHSPKQKVTVSALYSDSTVNEYRTRILHTLK